jgi:hypothetical protein
MILDKLITRLIPIIIKDILIGKKAGIVMISN